MNFSDFAQAQGFQFLRPLGKKADKLCLVQNAEGELRVLRRYLGHDAPCRTLMQLSIPQLARIDACYDVDGDTVSVEEYLPGTCLSELLRQRLLTRPQAIAVTSELCQALEALHGLGLVHRDLKPENVMLTREGRVVLLDMDAAAPLDGTPDTNTRLLGTAGYAAPEQFGFSRCDVRADIFALGVLMNVMLTGEHPSVQEASGKLGRLIRRCIQTNADRRWPDVQALAKRLPPVRTGRTCPLCGAVTPGGGCLWCGGPARQTTVPYPKTALTASLLALAVSAAALTVSLLPAAEPGTSAVPTAQTLPALDLSGVELSAQTELALSGQWPTDQPIPFRVPFTYDLDGDGQTEQYYFALAEFYPNHTDIDLTTNAAKGFYADQQQTRFFMPVICRMTEQEVYEQVPALASLLSEQELRLYYTGPAPAVSPVARTTDLPDQPWSTAMEVTFTSETTGTWVMYVRAKLAGEPVEAAITMSVEILPGNP